MIASVEVCFRCPGHVLDHLADILAKNWVVLHDQEAVMVLFQD